jgi:hypothetical protein
MNGAVAVVYAVERRAGVAAGKGMVDCDTMRIWQWATGTPGPGSLPIPCPRPRGWTPSEAVLACTSGPNARATSSNFAVTDTPLSLPTRCAPSAVRSRIARTLSAFNFGDGARFAKQFVRNADFHPYTASIRGHGFVGGARIARFVRSRYAAGDGWTATRLLPPHGRAGLPSSTVYRLDFVVSHQGATVAEGAGSKFVVDCASGRLRRWVGPALATP